MSVLQCQAALVKRPGNDVDEAPGQGIRQENEQDLVAGMIEGLHVAAGGDRAGVVEDGEVRAMADRVALVEQAETKFDLLMVHIKDFRVEAGTDHRLPAHGIGGAAEVGGEERVVGVFQRQRVAPALDIVGMSVRLENPQGEAGD